MSIKNIRNNKFLTNLSLNFFDTITISVKVFKSYKLSDVYIML